MSLFQKKFVNNAECCNKLLKSRGYCYKNCCSSRKH